MYKFVVLACVLAVSQAQILAHHGLAAPYGLGLAAPVAHGLPLNYANAHFAAAPYAVAAPVAAAAPIAAAPLASTYALPAPRTVHEAPIVEQAVEPVEQHGYKIRY